MNEIKLIDLIKLPFKNIFLLLFLIILMILLTYTIFSNFNKKYTYYGSFNVNYLNLEETHQQVFKNYLQFSYGNNYVEKDTLFIIYNIEIDNQKKDLNDELINFSDLLLKKFYKSSFYLEYKKYLENENAFINLEISRLENSTKDINDKYMQISIENSDLNYTNEEILIILKNLIYQDGDVRNIVVDLSKSIINLKSKIQSNSYMLQQGKIIDGKMFESGVNINTFFLYILSIIISLILSFLINFIRQKN